MYIAYIGLGSNLKDPILQLKKAINALATRAEITLQAISGFYLSRPLGPQDQPNFVNAALKVETSLMAIELLKQCQMIEKDQQRTRQRHWGPRTIDLDILLFGNQIINQPELEIPHPGLTQREFVIYPLLEIAPNLLLPDGKSLQMIAKGVAFNGLIRLERSALEKVCNV